MHVIRELLSNPSNVAAVQMCVHLTIEKKKIRKDSDNLPQDSTRFYPDDDKTHAKVFVYLANVNSHVALAKSRVTVYISFSSKLFGFR